MMQQQQRQQGSVSSDEDQFNLLSQERLGLPTRPDPQPGTSTAPLPADTQGQLKPGYDTGQQGEPESQLIVFSDSETSVGGGEITSQNNNNTTFQTREGPPSKPTGQLPPKPPKPTKDVSPNVLLIRSMFLSS